MEVVDKGSGGSSSSSSLVASRQRFNIELRPGETTIVSWKRLIKDTNNNPNPNPNPSAPPALPLTHNPNVSLDKHFQDDKSTTKHNGFIVNKGKVEHINEPISSANRQSKKRRKNMAKAPAENGDDHVPNKYAKMDLKVAARTAPLVERSSSHSQTIATNSECYHDRKSQHPLDSPIGFSTKKPADTSIKSEYSSYLGIPNRDASVFLNSKDGEKQRTGTITCCRDSGNTVKVASELSGATPQKCQDKNASKQLEPQAKRLMTDVSELEFSSKVWQRDKTGSNGLPDLNIPAYPVPVQPVKTASMPSKDVSGLRPKGTMLERAIRELEKVVAESRPPNMEVQDADSSSISVKRRLPGEVKLKLAKVARLASSQGKISEELINRLMSILGHLVQLRTLKRNLREMVLLGLSAKREKADRFQQIKKEVIEMIKLQGSKQGDGATDVFPEAVGTEGKRVLQENNIMDKAMEDKICDIYDLYVQGMDEDKGPQIRKLYVELAELWPNGAMDNHGIKNAIRRAKERRRASYDHEKVGEKVRKKKLSAPKMEDVACGGASSVAQPQAVQERLITQSNSHNLASPDKMISSKATTHQHLAAPVRMSTPLFIDSNMDLPKQEKLESMTFPMLKEQMKQQQRELESRVKKFSLKQEKEYHKSHKQALGLPDDLRHQLAPPSPSCGQPE